VHVKSMDAREQRVLPSARTTLVSLSLHVS
jgi:hypothetical protein